MDAADTDENGVASEQSAGDVHEIVAALKTRKEQFQAYLQELSETGETQKSLTDPDSRLMKKPLTTEMCYNVQTAVDAKNKLVAEFDVTNHGIDRNQLHSIASKAAEALANPTQTVVADAGYDNASEMLECLRSGLSPHVAGAPEYDICVPLDDDSEASDITSHTNGRPVYLKERNLAVCPMGKILYPGSYNQRKGTGLFYSSYACNSCLCKCTSNRRKMFEIAMPEAVLRGGFDDALLCVKQVRIRADRELTGQRHSIIEHVFGTLKSSMDAGNVLTKGLKNVSGEFSLAFLAYNLKRAINIVGAKGLIEAVRV